MFCCNFLSCVVILIIVRLVRYHLCEKTSNKQEREEEKSVQLSMLCAG